MKDILIVEDGAQERQRLICLFEDAGYTVTGCESVQDAETVLDHERYRLVILDIGLNDKSGSYLFNALKGTKKVSYIIVYTGNPSVHLKNHFLGEGAVDYIVKGSSDAGPDQILGRVREIIGAPQEEQISGISLEDFLSLYVSEASRQLFLDDNGDLPPCGDCGTTAYVVTFSDAVQVPPQVEGRVVCSQCKKPLDPEIA